MAIELRGVSPLGAPLKSPLDAFAGDEAPPPLVYKWEATVVTSAYSPFLTGIPPTTPINGLAYHRTGATTVCGQYIEEFDPGGPYAGAYRLTLSVILAVLPNPGPPDDFAWVGYEVVGRTSGAVYVLGDKQGGGTLPTQECNTLNAGTKRETLWDTAFWDPPGAPPPVPLESMQYSSNPGLYGGTWSISHVNGIGSLGFTPGELCDVNVPET